MPYKLQKDGEKYYVIDDKGKRYSDKPLSKWRAASQMRALYANEKKKESGFHVFKQADGQYRWVTISSSAFRDRDGEIVTIKALAEDVDRCDENKSYGPLRWWHVGGWEAPNGIEEWSTWKAGPGIDIGTCDFNMLHDKMLIESGTFKDAATGEAFSQVQSLLEVSIAFSHPPDEPGKAKQYKNIHRFERSLLPEGMASNLLTKFYITKGEPNMKVDEKLKALLAILRGKPELAQQILADAEGVQKAAEMAGLEYKEVETLISGEEPQPEEVIQSPEVPAPVAEEVPAPVADKAAPVAAAPEVEPVEIGDWTPEKLAAFIVDVVKKASASKEAEPDKITPIEHTLKQATDAITALDGKLTALSAVAESNQQTLQELTDSRPVGIKQMQAHRATERSDNVTAVTPTGPTIDPNFIKFMRGGN